MTAAPTRSELANDAERGSHCGCSALFGVDDVRGQIFGPVSHRYGAMLKTVMVWPKHGHRQEWPARLHTWWSTAATSREARTLDDEVKIDWWANYPKENHASTN